jgi:chromatin structure-remodeling complex subunit RSC1/2
VELIWSFLNSAKHFDRDPETNEVIWFSAPPTNDARPSGPQHSLAYLHFLATKRGSGEEVQSRTVFGRELDQVQPTVTESIASILKGLDEERSS